MKLFEHKAATVCLEEVVEGTLLKLIVAVDKWAEH